MLLSAEIPPIVFDISVILGLAIFVLLICNKFKVPTILGFLITGILAGPQVFNFVKAGNLSVFAEIGVILLLFSIGIEFSLKDLIKVRKQVLLGGSIQVLGTILFSTIGLYYFDFPFYEALFMGMLFSLSSTAIVLKILQETGRLHSPQGRNTMAILIFQDIIVVPLMLLVPYLSKESGGVGWEFALTMVKGVFTVVIVLFASRVIMPKFLFLVAKSKSSELFLLTVLVVCMLVAWITAQMGLSLSLGAFLAGLIISESEYSHEAFGTILPFRELFTSFFFISIGLLVNPGFIFQNIFMVSFAVIVIMIAKLGIAGLAVYSTGHNIRVAFLGGLFLCQVGEFSFILAEAGRPYQLISEANYQLFLSVSLISMAISPLLIQRSEGISRKIGSTFSGRLLRDRFPSLMSRKTNAPRQEVNMKDHVVIIGFGDGGKTIAKVVRMAKIPALAIDSDPEVVLASKKRKTLEVIFGNATTNKVLEHANIKEARLIVITLTKFDLILSIISAIRKIDTKVHIISTTRRTRDLIKLFDAGANDVISEQFETSMELVTRILGRYLVPRDEIDGFINNVRKLNYDMTRSIRYEQQGLQDYRLEINNTEIATIKIRSDGPFVGKNLMQLDFRNKWKVNVLAIKRGEEVFTNPQPDMILATADLLIVFGEHKDVDLIIRR